MTDKEKIISDVYHEFYGSINSTYLDAKKKELKGVSKTVVENEINNEGYVNVLETNDPEMRKVMGFRSYDHEVFTYLTPKIARSSFYDKMKMVDHINCIPFGFIPN